MTIANALCELRPGAAWSMDGNSYDGVQWLDTVQTMPTRDEVDAYIQANSYRGRRAVAYPSIGDQLDAIWKGGQVAADMLAQIQAVKAKYPKGA